jgi:ABC-type polysaccharide/polyol phosphate export permease
MPHLINDLMILDTFTRMFSQLTRVQQSVSGSIINVILGYLMQNMMQKGLSSLLDSSDSNTSCCNYTDRLHF